MKGLIIMTILILSNTITYAQYQKKEIFYDDFVDNRNEWSVPRDNKQAFSIKNGYYYFEHLRTTSIWLTFRTININENKNFEITTRIKKISGIQNHGYGINWGMKDGDNFFAFELAGDGNFHIGKMTNGKWKDIQKWKKNNAISEGNNAINTLTIRKINNYISFSINKIEVYSDQFDSFMGNKIGFSINKNQKIAIDYLRVSYLEKEAFNYAPEIVITQPDISRGFKVVPDKSIKVVGRAKDSNGIYEVTANGIEASLGEGGYFSLNVPLAVGKNTITIRATDIKMKSSTKTFEVNRQPNQEVVISNESNNTNNLQTGKYYALIIGNNDYRDPAITSLNEPINDATKLYNVLTTKYTFEPQNVTFLKNGTYVQMIEALDNLSNEITAKDNLLVFYAGHGWWDDDKGLGYWLPIDAKQKSTAFWIANSRISDYMSSIDSKHTLLIADACFSGSIFKTRAAFSDAGQAINSLYKLPSRTAMTSGNLKEVPDKSVFLEYLVKRLENNTQRYLSSDQLFVSFRIAVMNNSQTEPQFGTIQNAGDEGGEFIFIRK